MNTARVALQLMSGLAFVLAPSVHSVPATVKAVGPATTAIVEVVNMSDKQTWVTVYWSYSVTGWHIEKALCLTPGQKWNGSILYRTPELGPKIRVRAEVMNGDCRSGVFRDVEGKADIPTNISPPTPRVRGYITGSAGNYTVKVTAGMM